MSLSKSEFKAMRARHMEDFCQRRVPYKKRPAGMPRVLAMAVMRAVNRGPTPAEVRAERKGFRVLKTEFNAEGESVAVVYDEDGSAKPVEQYLHDGK